MERLNAQLVHDSPLTRTLPPLKPIGAPVVWTLTQTPPALVVQNDNPSPTLDDQVSARLGYVTTVETKRDARGVEMTGFVDANISIRRKEIADLQKTISDQIFARIPATLGLRAMLQSLLGPTIASILNLPASLFDTHGKGSVSVIYHACASGDCCPMGKMECGTECVDTAADPANCGDCGVLCRSGQSCQAGACTPAPPPASTSTSCSGSCPAGQMCAGGICQAFVGSCFFAPPTTSPRCSDEFDPSAKVSCRPELFATWSDAPCPTAGRVGSCDQDSYILRFYPDLSSTSDGSCYTDATCSAPVAGQCEGAPIVSIPHPCVNGRCDDHDTIETDAYVCCFDCTENPQNPFPATCPRWTLN